MAVICESLWVDVLAAAATLLLALHLYISSGYDHWRKRGVPYVKPVPFFGNMKDQFLYQKSFLFTLEDIYKELAGERFGGYFELRNPVLMIRDPDLIERVLIKDFSHFHDRQMEETANAEEPMTLNLVGMRGKRWKHLRNKLTPTFTSGKLKGMLEQISNCADDVCAEIDQGPSEALDTKKLGQMFSTNVIASCAFGLQFKPDTPEGVRFQQMMNRIVNPSVLERFKFSLLILCRPVAKFLGIPDIQKTVSDYFIDLSKSTVQFRQKNNIQRNDFLQLLLNLREQEAKGLKGVKNWRKELSGEDAYLGQMDDGGKDDHQDDDHIKMTDECIAAQSFVFLVAGSEAVASSVSFLLYEVAANPEVQRRLRQEVDEVLRKHGGLLSYEALRDMKYLDMVIQEKNRKYLGGVLLRVVTSPYTLPGTSLTLEPGTKVVVPPLAMHNDPAIYPDPERFLPERFEGNDYRATGRYLPFGDGPRICIAMRLVVLEEKTCLARLVSRYHLSLDPRTRTPLQFDQKSFFLQPLGGLWVRFQKRAPLE